MTGPRQVWEAQAAAVLRKARRLGTDDADDAVWGELSTTTVEGIVISPLGIAEPDGSATGRSGDRAGTVHRESDGRRAGRGAADWDVRAQIVHHDPVLADQAASDELRNGSTSLWLTVGGDGIPLAGLGRALRSVQFDLAPVVVGAAPGTAPLEAAQAFSRVLEQSGAAAAPGCSLGADPVGAFIQASGPGTGDVRHGEDGTIREIAALAGQLGIGAFVVDATVAHRAGAGDAAEIGYGLAVGVHYLRSLQSVGYSLPESLPLLEFRYSATDEQFITIAKFRAARLLWQRIGEMCGAVGGVPQSMHAVTSGQMMTRYDPYTNLLRTTVAAFAAGVGGADSVTVLPFGAARAHSSDPFGSRLARNISALLLKEAHVAAVADPAGGAYAVEEMTDSVAEEAWNEFLRIEGSGGVLASVADGTLRNRFARTAAERLRRISTRRQPITGVTEFPLADEPPAQAATHSPAGMLSLLGAPVGSWAEPFESLRDDRCAASVFLATLGPLAAHAPRAGFVTNALSAGGVDVISSGPYQSLDDILASYGIHFSPVVCLVGTDAAYTASAATLVPGLRRSGATRIVLAGHPKFALESLFDDHIAVGDDVLAFLHRTRSALSAQVPNGQKVTS